GMPVHSPWALAVTARVRERYGYDGAAVAGDDGIIVRLPDTDAEPPGAELFVFEAAELELLVTEEVGGSALFAARFRECAARALLLPRYNPGKRSPLWQQRQRASQLLEVARKYPSFPIVLEAVREVLQDVYDLPALMALTGKLASRSIRIVETETESASPFARSLLFGYVAAFMYEGDSPLAERRAAALSLDPTLLAELLGRAELRELLDAGVIEQTELELQRLAPDRRVRDMEGVIDLLRIVGPLSVDEIVERMTVPDGSDTADETNADRVEEQRLARVETVSAELLVLARANRVLRASIAGDIRWAVIEDASRLRDALGVPLPIGVPSAFVEPVEDPIGDLVGRYARTHGPFTAQAVAERYGLGVAVVLDSLRRLGRGRRVVEGEFRPGATGSEWVDSEILRRLRSRSLAALRHEVEPVSQDTLARFLPVWQNVRTGTGRLTGVDGLVQVIDQLGGVALPASSWETLVLPARLRNYSPAWLDELTVSGEVLWSGAGSLPGSDGWVSLHLADTTPITLGAPQDSDTTELQREILVALAGGGAFFFRQLGAAVGSMDDAALTTAIWDLVWAGLITNDTFSPLRSFLGGKAPVRPVRTRAYRGRARPSLPTQSGPPSVAGRWSLLPLAEGDTTVRAKATAEMLLERHGVVTRGAVMNEGIRGGFALMYKVLSSFEETGRARRGYFVDGLGGAQFATGATVDRLRNFVLDPDSTADPVALTLSATDPANPYGAALPWPGLDNDPAATESDGAASTGTASDGTAVNADGDPVADLVAALSPTAHHATPTAATPGKRAGHRPGRKAGALVVMVDGFLTLYIERGGKTVLTFSTDEKILAAAARSLAETVRTGLGKLRIERIDGDFSIGTPLGHALTDAGFAATPQGLRLRS
ncbi:MAG TPA: ATP-dependent helicase, partial [Glaciihabitans sp.]|nr:ATP-dependent helicase [Glaciihabitans sp.]